jgi:gamma-glutamyl hydrolase
MANMFVDFARRSAHLPESKEEELAMLIYNYRAFFTARDIVMEPSYDGPYACSCAQ